MLNISYLVLCWPSCSAESNHFNICLEVIRGDTFKEKVNARETTHDARRMKSHFVHMA